MKFENAEPIGDADTVLDLLDKRWGDSTIRELYDYRRGQKAYVSIEHVHDFSDMPTYHFEVERGLRAKLLEEGLVWGTKHWGYTDTERVEISDAGRARVAEVCTRMGQVQDRWLCAEEWFRHVKGKQS